ncbi:MAG TPA: alkaline phosphatase family protein, partial [Candidatus Polarisedimenticolaceae bacterium]|nr:alkaline phosphatase family protein [Candidatus Polarisedimenticolaceae bacterium]
MPHELAPRPRLSLAVLLLATVPISAAEKATVPRAPSPHRAVGIVVDQFAAWIAEERLEKLPKNGGFARLLKGGTWIKRCEYEHALTETAPAHAALYTGKTPRETGISANDVKRKDGHVASLLDDDDTQLVGPDGPIAGRTSVSLKQLLVPTIAETLLERDPQSVVISISTKARGAVFAGARVKPGQRPPEVVWWDERTSQVVTSAAFATKLPAWVTQPTLPKELRWDVDGEVSKLARVPDDRNGEADDLGGRNFPHVFPMSGRSFRVTARADELTIDLALAAVRANATQEHPVLLALSFSRFDYVGHRYGPESWESWDALLELDRALARLFAGLDAVWGKDAYAVVLSADHGVSPLPEFLEKEPAWCRGVADPYERPCKPGVRLSSTKLGSTDAFVYGERSPQREAQLAAEPGVARVLDICKIDPKRSELERWVYGS